MHFSYLKQANTGTSWWRQWTHVLHCMGKALLRTLWGLKADATVHGELYQVTRSFHASLQGGGQCALPVHSRCSKITEDPHWSSRRCPLALMDLARELLLEYTWDPRLKSRLWPFKYSRIVKNDVHVYCINAHDLQIWRMPILGYQTLTDTNVDREGNCRQRIWRLHHMPPACFKTSLDQDAVELESL